MSYSPAIDGMFWSPERRQPGVSDPAPASEAEFTPLQEHVLTQFAYIQLMRHVAAKHGDAELEGIVERVSFVRYQECMEQGLAEGARAIMRQIGTVMGPVG